MNFQCSRFCRGRREEGTRSSKRKQHSTQKTPQKHRKTSFLEAPGQASKKANQKPRKSHHREAKMTPRSGPGGAGSDPRGPKTTQGRPKSAPRAAQRRSQSSLGGHLGPTWRPRGSRSPPGSPFGPLGGGFWPLRGSQSSPAQATVTSPPPSQKPVWGRRHEAAAYEIKSIWVFFLVCDFLTTN